jgi:hypothetical protein
MIPLAQHDVVRVLSLDGMQCGERDQYWRTPEIGDVAAVVMLLRVPPDSDGYLLECVDSDGRTLWLASFPRDALEPLAALS